MTKENTAASTELVNFIGDWLTRQIDAGATPAEIMGSLVPALGVGVRMFASASSKPGSEVDCVRVMCQAVFLEAQRASFEPSPTAKH